MQAGHASVTAEMVAQRRAAHQLIDSPKIFDDPVALSVIDPDVARQLRENPASLATSTFSKYLRAFVAMRSRFAEDELQRAVATGVQQYVLLGAGLDTFAYRNPYPTLRVFEVDYPATQALKRKRLDDARIALPPSVTFVPADLTQVPVADALAAAGFDAASPAFVAWLGVVMYLTIEEIRGTLRFIASLPAGTGLVFDYLVPPSAVPWLVRPFYRAMILRVAAIGEPWKTFFEPETLRAELTGLGFGAVDDLSPDEINGRYFDQRADGMKVGSGGRIVKAGVE
jgi:methyltransferase (TIGR00027 family)